MLWMLALGAALALAGLVWGSPRVALGVAIGCIVAVANWRALQWITHRMVDHPGRGGAALVYVLKLTTLIGVMVLLLYRGRVHALGFAIGLSTMVVGILAGNLLHSRRAE